MLAFERLLLKIFDQDLFINIKILLSLPFSMRESVNYFTNEPKTYKFYISDKKFDQKPISMVIIWKPSNLCLYFGTVPFKNDYYCFLALSVSEDDICSSLNNLSTVFSNLNNDTSGSCNILLGKIRDENLTN